LRDSKPSSVIPLQLANNKLSKINLFTLRSRDWDFWERWVLARPHQYSPRRYFEAPNICQRLNFYQSKIVYWGNSRERSFKEERVSRAWLRLWNPLPVIPRTLWIYKQFFFLLKILTNRIWFSSFAGKWNSSKLDS